MKLSRPPIRRRYVKARDLGAKTAGAITPISIIGPARFPFPIKARTPPAKAASPEPRSR
jgi:hypothetical protein